MKDDRSGANALADDGDISDGQLMTISKQAILKYGQDAADITDVNTHWNKKKAEEGKMLE